MNSMQILRLRLHPSLIIGWSLYRAAYTLGNRRFLRNLWPLYWLTLAGTFVLIGYGKRVADIVFDGETGGRNRLFIVFPQKKKKKINEIK